MPAFQVKPPLGATLRRGDPLARGLAGEWLFSDSGLSLSDSTGQKRNGTLTNFASPMTLTSGWVSTAYGKGLAFDGTDDYVSLPNTIVATGASPRTYSVLVRRRADPASGKFYYVFRTGASSSGDGLVLGFYNTGSGVIVGSDIYGVSTRFAGADAGIGVWQLLTQTYDGTDLRTYWNGELRDTYTRSLSSTAGSAELGNISYYSPGGDYFAGEIAWAGAWSRCLSAAEIRQLAADPFRPFRRRTVALLKTAASGPTSISGSDILVISDGYTLTVIFLNNDTVSAADANTLLGSYATADTVTAADARSLLGYYSGADTASSADASSLAASFTATDTITATDALLGLSVSIVAADSASGSEGSSLNTGSNPSIADTITASETVTLAVTLTASDTATAADVYSLLGQYATNDTATAVDAQSLLNLVSLADSVTATDAAALQAVFSRSDTVTAAEATSILVRLTSAQAITFFDALNVNTGTSGDTTLHFFLIL